MDDIVVFNQFHHSHSPSLRRQMFLPSVLMGIAAGAVALAVIWAPGGARSSDLWAWIPGLLLGAAFYPALHRAWLARIVRAMFSEGSLEPLLGKKEVSITPVEIAEAGVLRSTTVRWPCVQRIEQDRDVIYVYISATEAMILPRRSFRSDEEFQAFIAACRDHWSEAKKRAR